MITTTHIETPLGKMLAGATDEGICLFDFEFRKMMPAIKSRICTFHNDEFVEGEHPNFELLRQQVNEYFSGERKEFDLPVVLSGTPFQQNVWNALIDIPYGATRTYMQQAKVLGDEKAIRAVARANGENCLAIIIPCHRVVGSDGSLTGYAGGLKAKKWLLEHEAKHTGNSYQDEIF
ncbi:MAG: methylated-DNA--[protein]-cysteine S-methyltransferase [Chitinophagales bacterium]|nr:methylated-DNA--[protein]-cysteine S-methyltransferase [Chitinophagales bacterium]